MRDTRKSLSYFQNMLNELDDEIVDYIDDIESNVNSEIQLDRLCNSVFGIHHEKILVEYCIGRDKTQILSTVNQILTFSDEYNIKVSGRYVELLDILSMASVLELESSKVVGLANKIIAEGMNDALMTCILASFDINLEPTSNFLFLLPYSKTESILNDGTNATPEQVKNYLLHWYEGQKDTSWYGSHKKSGFLYSGYWSFESAALVKKFGINDTTLQSLDYYPYDLVHFNDPV